MRICPTEDDLVRLVDDALPQAAADDVEAHLTECGECRRTLARSEAALRLALGGTADAATAVSSDRAAPARPKGPRIRAIAAALAAAACVVAIVRISAARHDVAPTPMTSASPASTQSRDERAPAHRASDPDVAALADRVASLSADAAPAPSDDAAAAALASAEVRAVLGMSGAAERYRHVAERFAGTAEAGEARARLAMFDPGEDRR